MIAAKSNIRVMELTVKRLIEDNGSCRLMTICRSLFSSLPRFKSLDPLTMNLGHPLNFADLGLG
jgi:hypothetical protein